VRNEDNNMYNFFLYYVVDINYYVFQVIKSKRYYEQNNIMDKIILCIYYFILYNVYSYVKQISTLCVNFS